MVFRRRQCWEKIYESCWLAQWWRQVWGLTSTFVDDSWKIFERFFQKYFNFLREFSFHFEIPLNSLNLFLPIVFVLSTFSSELKQWDQENRIWKKKKSKFHRLKCKVEFFSPQFTEKKRCKNFFSSSHESFVFIRYKSENKNNNWDAMRRTYMDYQT